MVSSSLRIAFFPLARPTFDVSYATEMADAAAAQLEAAGMELLREPGLVDDIAAAKRVAGALASKAPDLLLIFQASFADSTMAVAIAEAIDGPLLLWAVPEVRTGGRLRLNSLCGINLAGHALTLKGRRYEYIYSPPDDPVAITKVAVLARAGQVYRQLQTAQLGVFGEHPAGFETCRLDASLLKARFGVDVVQYDLETVFQRARAVEAAQVDAVYQKVGERLDNLPELAPEPLRGTFSVYTALKELAQEKTLAGVAVRCWPEFFTDLGCAACGAMSLLSDEQVPCSCEADINGTLTQLILQWLSGTPAFGSDLVSVDYDEDFAVFWHCGLAPLSMADPDVVPHGGIHSNRKVPFVMEFPLKPGVVTLARLSQATGELRLVIGRGEMLKAPPSFSGTSGVLRFERSVREVLDTILSEGLEHHMSLTYGDYVQELLTLAKLLDLPVLVL